MSLAPQFGKTRQALLSLLYTHADESFFLEQLIQAAALGRGTVQRELAAKHQFLGSVLNGAKIFLIGDEH